jgi:hypothetical protein
MATPLVALQKPKDISVPQIEAELATIWLSQQSDQGYLASRSATFSMVIYEPEEFQQTLAGLGFYKAAIDGTHGPETKEAIKRAQGTYGLPLTGRVDVPTLENMVPKSPSTPTCGALGSAMRSPATTPAASSPFVRGSTAMSRFPPRSRPIARSTSGAKAP